VFYYLIIYLHEILPHFTNMFGQVFSVSWCAKN